MTIDIGRREFIWALGGTGLLWSFNARAQQSGKLPTIGFLGPDAAVWGEWTSAFAERLSQLGWIEHRTVAIEYRWSNGRPERVAEIAAEFVRQKVDAIVTYGGAVTTLKQATAVIPIVFAVAIDPIGGGLVADLSRPGGNVTGLSLEQTDIASKRLETLRNVVPNLHRLAIMANVGYPASASELNEVQVTARRLGLEVTPYEIRRAEDIALIVQDPKPKADALYVVEDTLIIANIDSIIALTLNARLPSIFNSADVVRVGGLLSYGPDYPNLFQRAAEYVDKILRGTKPGDLPVEQPTKFDLTVNVNTAKTLGLIIPDKVLAIADQVFE
jgi:putative ABC transport system substrate-binding protein